LISSIKAVLFLLSAAHTKFGADRVFCDIPEKFNEHPASALILSKFIV